jgi:hypothetical protein
MKREIQKKQRLEDNKRKYIKGTTTMDESTEREERITK